jgi:hypothetical protein
MLRSFWKLHLPRPRSRLTYNVCDRCVCNSDKKHQHEDSQIDAETHPPGFPDLRSIRLYVYHDKYSSYGPRKDCDNALTDCLAPYFFPLSFSAITLYGYWLLRIVNLLKLGSQPQLVPWTIQGTRSSFSFPPYFPFFIAQTPNTRRFHILLYNEGYKQFHYLCRRGLTGQFRYPLGYL